MSGFGCLGIRLFVIAGVLATTAIITTPDARADAFGWQFVPAFKVSVSGGPPGVEVGTDVSIPGGKLDHLIKGSGRQIDGEAAWYEPNPLGLLRNRACNWRIDFVYKDDRAVYRRERGKVIHECVGLLRTTPAVAKRKTLPRFGTACAELWSNDRRLAAQCHHITR